MGEVSMRINWAITRFNKIEQDIRCIINTSDSFPLSSYLAGKRFLLKQNVSVLSKF